MVCVWMIHTQIMLHQYSNFTDIRLSLNRLILVCVVYIISTLTLLLISWVILFIVYATRMKLIVSPVLKKDCADKTCRECARIHRLLGVVKPDMSIFSVVRNILAPKFHTAFSPNIILIHYYKIKNFLANNNKSFSFMTNNDCEKRLHISTKKATAAS